ncbi:YodC family protein [Azotobacter vinelandii]|uniref:YodC family protein n=1 Tax=Azotobacter vinelandii TaxID=354 RepID=UPI001E43D2D9|nr:DUF2158 domain-containing protein [Azotobacter vinelandii]
MPYPSRGWLGPSQPFPSPAEWHHPQTRGLEYKDQDGNVQHRRLLREPIDETRSILGVQPFLGAPKMTGLEFVKGDIVVLKSGGPAMTIESIGNYAEGLARGPERGAKCIWFDGGKPQEHVFDVAVLEKVEP